MHEAGRPLEGVTAYMILAKDDGVKLPRRDVFYTHPRGPDAALQHDHEGFPLEAVEYHRARRIHMHKSSAHGVHHVPGPMAHSCSISSATKVCTVVLFCSGQTLVALCIPEAHEKR